MGKNFIGQIRSQGGKLHKVAEEIAAVDSSSRCDIYHRIRTASQNSNVRCRIRAKLLQSFLGDHGFYCPEDVQGHILLNTALQEAYEIDDDALQYEIHLRQGRTYNSIKQFDVGTLHYYLLFDILRRNPRDDFYLPADAFYDMSYGLYHTRNYTGCIESGLNAMHALPDAKIQPDDTLNLYSQLQGWNTIGLAYFKIQKYTDALAAFENALKLARGNSAWEGIVTGNKGDVYYQLGQYDTAYVLLKDDYEKCMANRVYDNAANSLQWMASIDLRRGQTQTALQKLFKAQQLLDQMNYADYQSNVWFAMSRAYAALGKVDSSNWYLNRYLHLHDSLEIEITKSNADFLQMRMSNVNQIQTIRNLGREKKQIALTRNFAIIVVLLLGCVGYLGMSRMRLKMQMRQRQAEAEAQKSIEQLDIFRNHLLEKIQSSNNGKMQMNPKKAMKITSGVYLT